jgi:hypothetical protein
MSGTVDAELAGLVEEILVQTGRTCGLVSTDIAPRNSRGASRT